MKKVRLLVLSTVAAACFSMAAIAAGLDDLGPDKISDPGLGFPNIANIGNTRSLDNVAMDPYQHPVLMMVVFGGLKPAQNFVEVYPTNTFWADYVGGRLTTGNAKGRFVQVADPNDKAHWDYLANARDFLNDAYRNKIEVVPVNYDSLVMPGSTEMVLLSRKLAVFMKSGNLEKLLASANKSLKPGGTLLVEDYRAAIGKAQDPKASASAYINEDWAIQQIEKAGFKLADREDKLFANAADTRADAQLSSDRFLLKFTK